MKDSLDGIEVVVVYIIDQQMAFVGIVAAPAAFEHFSWRRLFGVASKGSLKVWT
jgi:hypothetical protein